MYIISKIKTDNDCHGHLTYDKIQADILQILATYNQMK